MRYWKITMNPKPNIYVIYTDKWKLKSLEFSTIKLALDFTKTLDHKEYKVIVGQEVTESFNTF